MNTIANYLDKDHRRCDTLYTLAEAQVARREWQDAGDAFDFFLQRFECHLAQEERVLFPQLDRAMGNAYGPTAVMRAEHGHMRELLAHMQTAIAARDHEDFFDHADALRMLMRLHNLKEESVLYPMADRLLQARAAAIVARMERIADADAEAAA